MAWVAAEAVVVAEAAAWAGDSVPNALPKFKLLKRKLPGKDNLKRMFHEDILIQSWAFWKEKNINKKEKVYGPDECQAI